MRSSTAEEIALGIIEALVDSLNEYDWANVILMDTGGKSIPCDSLNRPDRIGQPHVFDSRIGVA